MALEHYSSSYYVISEDHQIAVDVVEEIRALVGIGCVFDTPEEWTALAENHAKMAEGTKLEETWSILGNKSIAEDLKIILERDLSLAEVERLIVFELEKHEDRSWKGERTWRNDDGKVAMAL